MEEEPLTQQQIKSLNLWCGLIAEHLKSQGYDLREQLTAPLIPTKFGIKEYVVKKIIKAMYGYTSTKQLKKKKEIDEVVDVITKMFADIKKEIPPFPSAETQNLIETYSSVRHNQVVNP
jgi:hypothetical protein